MLGHMYIVNKSTIDYSCDKCNYDVEYYRVGEGKVMRTHVQHVRGDGAEVLVRKAISALGKCDGFQAA